MPISPGHRLHAAEPASALPINIVEFARAKRPAILTAVYWTNAVLCVLGIAAFMAALVFDPTDPTNADANPAVFAVLLWTALGLFLLFGAGLYAARRMSNHHPVYKVQAKMTARAWDRLFATYGVRVPAEPIRFLVVGYLDNDRRPVAGDTAAFDSAHPDGTPGKFTLCSDQFGYIKLFAAPGIEWAPVPTLD